MPPFFVFLQLQNRNMKKHILAIIALGCIHPAIAQITINSADMPKSGSSSTITTAVSTSIDLKLEETGANYTWDYTSFTTLDEDVVTYEKASSVNPIYIFFGFNAFGKKIFDEMSFGAFTIKDVYDFYQSSSSDFRAVGRGISFNSAPIPSFFTNDDKIYEFPVAFGNNEVDEFSVTFEIPTLGSLTQSGTRTTQVDGWGKVTTPYKTYDCVRVYSVIDQINKVQQDLIPFPIEIPSKMVEYKWLAKGEVIPVLEIRGTVVAGNFIPNYVAYRSEDPIINSTDAINTAKVNIYPNPMINTLNITANEAIELVTVMDAQGKQVLSGTTTKMDVSTLEKGIYFVTVKTATETYTRKVVKQ